MKFMARALRNHGFRLYFSGQMVSYVGTWMQQVAMGWLVYRLTGSVLLLGLIGFASQIPILVFAPLGGVLSDRVNRHRLIITTQVLSMLQAFILAALTLSNLVEVWHLVAMALWLGLINAIDMPVRQSYVSLLVGNKDDLANAIALNSFAMNTARFLGPAIAGVLVSLFNEGTCFLLNGLSYGVVVLALLKISVKHAPLRTTRSFLEGLQEGFDYAAKSRPILALLCLVASMSFMITPYIVLMPFYAKEVFHGDAQTLGLLMGASGFGALTGATFLVSRRDVSRLGNHVAKTPYLASISLMAFAFNHILWVAMPLLFLVGFGVIVTTASTNTMIQTLVHDHFRGRVMSFFSMAFLGMAPLGSLAAGAVAHYIGVPATLFAGGILTMIAAAFLARYLFDLPHHLKAVNSI